MSGAEFIRAIAAVQASPCEAFSCCMRERCALELLACHAFAAYVSTGKSVTPHAVLRQRPAGSYALVDYVSTDPQPSADIYERVFARVDAPINARNTPEI